MTRRVVRRASRERLPLQGLLTTGADVMISPVLDFAAKTICTRVNVRMLRASSS